MKEEYIYKNYSNDLTFKIKLSPSDYNEINLNNIAESIAKENLTNFSNWYLDDVVEIDDEKETKNKNPKYKKPIIKDVDETEIKTIKEAEERDSLLNEDYCESRGL